MQGSVTASDPAPTSFQRGCKHGTMCFSLFQGSWFCTAGSLGSCWIHTQLNGNAWHCRVGLLLCATNRMIQWPCSPCWNSDVLGLDGLYGFNDGHSSRAAGVKPPGHSPGHPQDVPVDYPSSTWQCAALFIQWIDICVFRADLCKCDKSWLWQFLDGRKDNNNTGAVKLKFNLWDANMQSMLSSCWQGCLPQIALQTDTDTACKWDLPTLFQFLICRQRWHMLWG